MALNPTTGKYEYDSGGFTLGGGAFSVKVAVSTNSPGNDSLAQLMDTTTDVHASGDQALNSIRDLYITVTDDNYKLPTGSNFRLSNTFTGSTNGTADFMGSVIVGTSTVASSSLSLNGTANPVTFSNNTTPFALTSVTHVNLGPNGTASTTGTVNVTPNVAAAPEPASTALAVSGLGTLGLLRLRRRRKAEVAA